MPITGIDISTLNGDINYLAAKKADLGFVMVKASQGHALYSRVTERAYAVTGKYPSLSYHRSRLTVSRHLGQNVRRKKYRCTFLVAFLKQRIKFPLHKRIESARGLVEDVE